MTKKHDFTIAVRLALASGQTGKNPRLRVAELPIKFRDKNGRFCEPKKGVYFEVTPPGKRSPLTGEIPAPYRRTISARSHYIANVLVAWSKEAAKARQAREVARVKREIAKKKKKKPTAARKKELKKVVLAQKKAIFEKVGKKPKALPRRPGKPKSYEEVEREIERELKEEKKRERESEEARERGSEEDYEDLELPPLTPDLERIVAVDSKELKYLVGRDPFAKAKHQDSRPGIPDFADRQIVLEKLHVDFDEKKPVQIFPQNAEAASLSLREYFRPYAEKFVNQWRGRSEEAYIMRVKTLNYMADEKARVEGIGTERFRMLRSLKLIPKDQLKHLREQNRDMSDEKLLEEIQLGHLSQKLEDLFDYFRTRYETYLSRQIVAGLAVTGFSMEVVKGHLVPGGYVPSAIGSAQSERAPKRGKSKPSQRKKGKK